MADATPPPWMQPGAPPTHAAKDAVPPPQPMEQDDDDEDLYGNETQEQADAKFMAALDANEARKAAKQAALDLQAKEGDAAYEKMKPPPPPNKWLLKSRSSALPSTQSDVTLCYLQSSHL